MVILDTWAGQPMCGDPSSEAVQPLKAICKHGWNALIAFVSSLLLSCGSISTVIVAKLSWPFSSLDLTLTFVRRLQAKSTAFLKRWTGLPRPANSAILHPGRSNRAGLHVKHLLTFWKQTQAVRMNILQPSADMHCSRLYDHLLLRQGEWSQRYVPAVDLEHTCAAAVVESDPEYTSGSRSNNPLPRRKRSLTLLADVDTEEQLSKLRLLTVQGRWLEWTDVMNLDLSWRRLIHGIDDRELSFILRAITNTLPTPDNLRRWGQQRQTQPTLCVVLFTWFAKVVPSYQIETDQDCHFSTMTPAALCL